MLLLLGVIFCLALTSADGEKVAVTKCCRHDYAVLSDSCEDEYETEASDHVNSYQDTQNIATGPVDWIPTVYSHQDDRKIATTIDDLQLTYGLAQCLDGYIAKVITDFRFYDDGSLTSASVSLQPEEFCLHQMNSLEGQDAHFLARFCMADPCNATNCVRKCCPHGMVVNGDEKICQFHPLTWAPFIRDENGLAVDNSDVLILDGARAPICANGRFLIRPDDDPDDEFYVLPSGQLRVPAFEYNESFIQEYCIDRFLFDNVTVHYETLN